nr:developmental regulator flba [Quercus suber]
MMLSSSMLYIMENPENMWRWEASRRCELKIWLTSHATNKRLPWTSTTRKARRAHPPSSLPPADLPSRLSAAQPTPADTVDSLAKAKSRAHSRLTSLGRIHSRDNVNSATVHLPRSAALESPRGETRPTRNIVPVSPSTAGPRQRSCNSTLSLSSAESLTSDKSDDSDSFGSGSQPKYWRASSDLARDHEEVIDHQSRLPRPSKSSPRMMHQTSSRLLRLTEDGSRPFTRDFNDLFATLMVSLPMTPHRVRFSRVEHTFTTEEAITNLGSLKFSQSNRMPDPREPARIVTTTTTTTFSMAREMARGICQRFVDSRFVESVDGRSTVDSRNSVWQLTPKGMHILARFCQRNGIVQRHINELLDSPRNMMTMVALERDSANDKIHHDPFTVDIIFRRFAGDTGPNLKLNSGSSESDAFNDYATGLSGVKMTRARRQGSPYIFTGKAAHDWLMNCCSIIDRREVLELGNLFMSYGLIEMIPEESNTSRLSQTSSSKPSQVSSGSSDKSQTMSPSGLTLPFTASKNINYGITDKGMRTAGWVTSPNGSVNGDATLQQQVPACVVRDSNTNRLTVMVRDPALRLLFREYLRETHCEENLAFYLEVKAFLIDYDVAKRLQPAPRLDVIRETLASAYSLYNAFLAPGSPCELNIDHNLRNALAGRMTRAVGENEQMLKSLDEVAVLFDQAQSSVFKLMASVRIILCSDLVTHINQMHRTPYQNSPANRSTHRCFVIGIWKACLRPSPSSQAVEAHTFSDKKILRRHQISRLTDISLHSAPLNIRSPRISSSRHLYAQASFCVNLSDTTYHGCCLIITNAADSF